MTQERLTALADIKLGLDRWKEKAIDKSIEHYMLHVDDESIEIDYEENLIESVIAINDIYEKHKDLLCHDWYEWQKEVGLV